MYEGVSKKALGVKMGIEKKPQTLKLIEVIDTIDIENCTAKTLIKVIMLDTTDLLHIGVCMCYTP